jgi:hypothetical protein
MDFCGLKSLLRSAADSLSHIDFHGFVEIRVSIHSQGKLTDLEIIFASLQFQDLSFESGICHWIPCAKYKSHDELQHPS